MERMKDSLNKQQITIKNRPIVDENISTESLSQEFKPVALEKYEFENRQTNKINWTFGMLAFQYREQNQRLFHQRVI